MSRLGPLVAGGVVHEVNARVLVQVAFTPGRSGRALAAEAGLEQRAVARALVRLRDAGLVDLGGDGGYYLCESVEGPWLVDLLTVVLPGVQPRALSAGSGPAVTPLAWRVLAAGLDDLADDLERTRSRLVDVAAAGEDTVGAPLAVAWRHPVGLLPSAAQKLRSAAVLEESDPGARRVHELLALAGMDLAGEVEGMRATAEGLVEQVGGFPAAYAAHVLRAAALQVQEVLAGLPLLGDVEPVEGGDQR